MDNALRKLQLTQLEILCKIDAVCRKYGIDYSLYAGTLLGAVRHKGFIPWDDDLDICMTRENYNRFLSVWQAENIEGYILQNKENTPEFTQSFTKIRKEHTTFIQEEWEKNRYHTGIFVDIFPYDRMPNGKVQRLEFKLYCAIYQLYTREFVPPKAHLIVKIVSAIILKLTARKYRENIRKRLLDRILKHSDNKLLSRVGIETLDIASQPCPADLFEEYVGMPFEGNVFMSVKKWDEWLKIQYGDYMQLPPVEKRTWTHHPIIIDFEHNYDEIEVNS